MRLRRVVLPTVFALTAGLLTAGATAATAAEGDPTVTATWSPARPDLITVKATSDSAVEAVSATYTRHAWGATPELSADLQRTETADTWQTGPITLGVLMTYAVEITATDADGDATTITRYLDYTLKPELVSHTLAPAELDLDHRVLSVAGRLRVYDPRIHAFQDSPEGQVVVRLQGAGNDATKAVSLAADGAFSVPLVPSGYIAHPDLTAKIGWRRTYNDSTVALASDNLTAQQAPSRFAMTASTLNVRTPGTTVEIAGVLQHQVGIEWQGLGGVQVRLTTDDGTPVYGVVPRPTDDEGRFSFPISVYKDVTYDVRVAPSDSAFPYVTSTPNGFAGSTRVNVVTPTTLSWTWNVRSVDSISWGGTVKDETFSSGETRTAGTVVLQQSPDGSTLWRTIDSARTSDIGDFNGTLRLTHPSWRFRTVFKGTTSQRGSVGRTVALSRVGTRIVRTNVSATSVTKGRTFALTGVAQRWNSGHTYVSAGSGKQIRVYFRAKGADFAKLVSTGTRTTSSGAFKATPRATVDGYWYAAWYKDDERYPYTYGPERYVNVN